MEPQVVTEIDELFQELIVERISKSIDDVNASLETLLGDDSEIQFKLENLPTNGGIKKILSTQLEELNEQTESIADKLDSEKKRLSVIEEQIRSWLLQLAEAASTKLEVNENNMTTLLEQTHKEITSEISRESANIHSYLNTLFIDEKQADSFRKHFDIEMQKLSEKLEKVNNHISEFEERADIFAQTADIVKLQESIELNTNRIEAISNADVIEIVQTVNGEIQKKVDNLKVINYILLMFNVSIIITMVTLFLLK